MEGFSNKTPHFFQPLLPGYESNFSIPRAFVTKYLEKEMTEEVDGKFATIRNKSVDKYWMIKLSFDDNKLHFKDGWRKFCEDHGVEIGDFLVFMHHQNLVFDVFIFEPSACERPFPNDNNGDHHPTKPSKKAKSSSSVNHTYSAENGFCTKVEGSKRPINDQNACPKAKVNFTPRGYPYFHTSVKSYSLTWGAMPLPMKFAKENGLANKWCEITVIDQEGQEYQLSLRPHKQSYGVYIGRWKEFHRRQGLKTDDPIVFELIASGENPKFIFYSTTQS